MKIFLITPVRRVSDEFKSRVETLVAELEAQGNTVYYPPRDTPQTAGSLAICEANFTAMVKADAVYVTWDGESQGCLFDLGMAFVLHNIYEVPILGLDDFVPIGGHRKTFQNLIWELTDAQDHIKRRL